MEQLQLRREVGAGFFDIRARGNQGAKLVPEIESVNRLPIVCSRMCQRRNLGLNLILRLLVLLCKLETKEALEPIIYTYDRVSWRGVSNDL